MCQSIKLLISFVCFLFCRSGNEEKLMSLLTPLNVNCHASDGRKVSLSLCKKNIKFLKNIQSFVSVTSPSTHHLISETTTSSYNPFSLVE